MDNLIIIYKLGNFNNGKAFETESKSMMARYISMGYKLITVGFLSSFEYIDWKLGK